MRPAIVAVPVLAGVLAIAGVATPASAAELPDGELLYAWDSGSGTLLIIDEDAGVTPVGVGGGPTSVWGMDYRPADGLIYMFSDETPCELWSADPATGVATLIDEFWISGDDVEVQNCDGFDIDSAGIARMSWGPNNLSVVDLATAELTDTVTMLLGGDTIEEVGMLATNPITDDLYALSYGGEGVIVVDPTTGALGAAFLLAGGFNGGDFDSAGILWFVDGSVLLSLDSMAGDPASTLVEEGEFESLGSVYAVAVLPEPEPELAATGVDTMTSIFASALAVTAGLSLLGFAVIRRRAAAIV